MTDINNGTLLPFLQKINAIFENHIKDCVLCKAKGFVCEICNEDDTILFPFAKEAAMCQNCEGAFHRHCFKAITEEADKECVRCVRLRARKASRKSNQNISDLQEEF